MVESMYGEVYTWWIYTRWSSIRTAEYMVEFTDKYMVGTRWSTRWSTW